MSVTGPTFKQGRLGLFRLNAQASFKIICKYPLWSEFSISEEETSCISPSRHLARLRVRCLQVRRSPVNADPAVPRRPPMPHVWDNSVNLSRGCTGLFHGPEKMLPPSSTSANHPL